MNPVTSTAVAVLAAAHLATLPACPGRSLSVQLGALSPDGLRDDGAAVWLALDL